MWGVILRRSAVGGTQLWARANRPRYRRGVAANRLTALALAMAGLAAVLLTVAIVRRCGTEPAVVASGSGSGGGDGVMARPLPQSLIDASMAAMFGAVCRHEVKCGIGTPDRCDYIEATMKQMPKELAIKPCKQLDVDEAQRCIAELATRSCADFAKSLDVLDLQAALDRVRTCRRACE